MESTRLQERQPLVTVAILAKNSATTLPSFLAMIEDLDYPKHRLLLYVRTNNNRDHTVELLERWLDRVRGQYHSVHFDSSDVTEGQVEQYANHEWNTSRFRLLGRLRQESVDWAHAHGSHYLVVDVDNFLVPSSLRRLLATGLDVVAPMLRSQTAYSNYHHRVDANGYLSTTEQHSAWYHDLLSGRLRGLIECDVVHCAYFVRHAVLPVVCYDDGSGRYEYVIFASELRRHRIPQYLDNRDEYGVLTFATSRQELLADTTCTRLLVEYGWLSPVVPTISAPPSDATTTVTSAMAPPVSTVSTIDPLRWLIVSPHAGFGNRVRAVAASLVLAAQLGRQPAHSWLPRPSLPKDPRQPPHVHEQQLRGLADYFVERDDFPSHTSLSLPNVSWAGTEWSPGTFWYDSQSCAQRQDWQVPPSRCVPVPALWESRECRDAHALLLETSLSTRLPVEHGGCATTEAWERAVGEACERVLHPQPRYRQVVEGELRDLVRDSHRSEAEDSSSPGHVRRVVGVSIRRGNFLQYSAEARQQTPERLMAWLSAQWPAEHDKTSLVIFSDDAELMTQLRAWRPETTAVYDHLMTRDDTRADERAFCQWLFLAFECDDVWGTPASSFAEEASRFRPSRHVVYRPIPSPLPDAAPPAETTLV